MNIRAKPLAKPQAFSETPPHCNLRFSQGSILLRALKRRLFAALPPVIFLAITYYFGWNAIHGKSGLEAQAAQRAELAQANQQFSVVDADRMAWEARITALSGQTIDGDMLDDQARQVLNLANPGDLVIDLSPQTRNH